MTIDDLFSGEERPSHRRPGPSIAVRSLTLLVAAGLLAGLAYAGLTVSSLSVPFPVLLGAALTLVGGLRLVRSLRPPPSPRQAGRHYEYVSTVPDGLNVAINRWDTMLDWCHTDVARFNRRVLPRLGELADERLRQRHGVTRTSDPHKARSILGDELWTQVTMPSRRPPGVRELEQIVSALEKL